MSDLQEKAWEQAGLLLGTITEQLAPKGIRVSMRRADASTHVVISATAKIGGNTWELTYHFGLAELSYSINRDVSHLAGWFSEKVLRELRATVDA